LALIAAYELLRRCFAAQGVEARHTSAVLFAAAAGGFLGAKVNFLITDTPDSLRDALSGTGFTWYGGLVGGTLGAIAVARVYRIPIAVLFDSCAIPLAVGLAFGRLGCFTSADGDYGTPTDLPWGVAWPNGLVETTVGSMNNYFGTDYAGDYDQLLFVHPAPLYEALPLLIAAALMWRYRAWFFARPWTMFGAYALVGGLARFGVEFVRFNTPVAAGLTFAQLASLLLAALGATLLLRGRRKAVAS
jgi:phosphatidylglycerol:prolipoprotein diacylglycerol transferase